MTFDRTRLTLRSARNRPSLVHATAAPEGMAGVPEWEPPSGFLKVVHWLRRRTGPRLWFFGGHVAKANVGWYAARLLEGGWISHLATNGAGLVHDWELAFLGHTSENVPRAIRDGSFGMWEETAALNEVITYAACALQGVGETAGAYLRGRHSILGAASSFGVKTTVHVAIGQDVFFQHPNCDGAAWGAASYRDFLRLAGTVEHMQGGTFLCFGSAVCGPEVFLKALGMARNVTGGKPDDLAVAVFDCVPPPADPQARYYHRPAKTLLGRVSEQSVFVQARHEQSIPHLWRALCTEGA